MATLEEAFALAVAYHRAGRLDLAEELYQRILASEPNHAATLHRLGMLAQQTKRHAMAIDFIRRAIAVNPSHVAYYNNLGVALKDQGLTAEAIAAYQQALELQPDNAEVYGNLGNAWRAQGNLDEAIACCQRAVALDPQRAEAHANLGNVMRECHRFNEAARCFRRAAELQPQCARFHLNLGDAYFSLNRLDQAAACYRQALQLAPRLANAHNNLGNALSQLGQLDEALACYRQAIDEAPDFAEAHFNLSSVLRDLGQFDAAEAACQNALRLKPDFAKAYNNLGILRSALGQLDTAVDCYRRAIELQPDNSEFYSNFLLADHYRSSATLAELAADHAEYDRRHAASLRTSWQPHSNTRDPQRRLRWGFVSSDLGQHPVGVFLVRVLENLDRQQCEVFCYSERLKADALTDRIHAASTGWRDVFGLTDERLAEQIRADQIDILFDLAGHTAKNRLLVFARKPAPIQITWLGYVGTTGLQAMDYLLADRHEVPPQAESYYVERVLRLPDGYVCFDPPADAPPVGPLPAKRAGRFTFGSFNNPAKINSQVLAAWADVLRQVPHSRLLLKYRGLDSDAVGQRLRRSLAEQEVDPQRLELAGWSPRAATLAAYGEVDLALDTFPYGGGLTTCEALWMGVPVVTFPGETFASRHALSHLSAAGLTETIAHDRGDYVRLAVTLANDLPRLAALRSGLRERVAASPLCDGPRFVQHLTALLREAWHRWCEQHAL